MYSLTLVLTFCLSLFLAEFTACDELPDEDPRHARRCRADDFERWSYSGNNGPQHWSEIYPECHGFNQSPIFIDTGRAVEDRRLQKMLFYYNLPIRNAALINDGRTIKLTPGAKNWRGFYVHTIFFRLREIHFHWGSNKEVGSEHIVDGQQYPMEMHLVHRSDNNYTAVVAVLFEEVDGINAGLQHIVNELPKVMYKDTQTRLHYRFDILNVLPENPASFYRYEGSLTTPQCTEGVTWTVLKSPNHVGCAQMREFRKLFSSRQNVTENGCRMSNNFRPVQHLHRRRVSASV